MEYRIEVMPTNERFMCRDDEFVIEAMVRAKCGPVHYGCFGGGCGICKMRIVFGEYAAVKKMSRAHVTEDEQNNGIVLLCCVKPLSDMTITRVE